MYHFLKNPRALTLAFGAAALVIPCVFSQDFFATYPANNPNEDRGLHFDVGPYKGGAVFDGHGGW